MDTPVAILVYLKRLEAQLWLALAKAGGLVANAFLQGGNSFGSTAVLGTNDANNLNVETNGVTRATFDQLGNFIPPADNSGQIGTNARRWSLGRFVTVTTGDVVMLDDEGNAHWTLKEHAEHIYARNAKTGKTFRLLMEEIADGPEASDFAVGVHGAHARAAEAEALEFLRATQAAEEEKRAAEIALERQRQADEIVAMERATMPPPEEPPKVKRAKPPELFEDHVRKCAECTAGNLCGDGERLLGLTPEEPLPETQPEPPEPVTTSDTMLTPPPPEPDLSRKTAEVYEDHELDCDACITGNHCSTGLRLLGRSPE